MKCIYCHKDISFFAKKCPYCTSHLEGDKAWEGKKDNFVYGWVFVMIAVLIYLVFR